MLAYFGNDFYADVDQITTVRWIEKEGHGTVIVDGCKTVVEDRVLFDRIKDAFLWLRGTIVYDMSDANSKTYKTKINRG